MCGCSICPAERTIWLCKNIAKFGLVAKKKTAGTDYYFLLTQQLDGTTRYSEVLRVGEDLSATKEDGEQVRPGSPI